MTPEAKRRKNQKKKQKQKQKKQAEKVASDDAVIDHSHNDSAESADVLSQSLDESDMNTSTTTAPLEDETPNTDSMDCKGTPENLEVIRSLQQDTGTTIGEQLEKKLSHEITIIDDIPTNELQDDVKGVEADHNVAVPTEGAVHEIESAQELDVVVPQIIEDHAQQAPTSQSTTTTAPAEESVDENSVSAVQTESEEPEEEPAPPITETQDYENNELDSTRPTSTKSGNGAETNLGLKDDVLDDNSAVSSAPEVEGNLESQPLNDINKAEPEIQQLSDDLVLGVERDSVHVADLFADKDAQTDEPMPWETEQNGSIPGNDVPAKDRQAHELFANNSGKNDEVMPWETSGKEETENVESKAINAPMTAVFEKSVEGGAHQSDGTAFGEEFSVTDGNAADPNVMIDGREAAYDSQHFSEMLPSVNNKENGDGDSRSNVPLPINEDATALAGAIPSAEADESVSALPCLNFESRPHQTNLESKRNVDKLAAIFGDDDTEDNSFWLNQESQPGKDSNTIQPSLPGEPPSAQEQGAPAMKFSFLQEDDDLLDEEPSEDEDYLPSDNEPLSNQLPFEEEVDVSVTASTAVPRNEHSVQNSEAPELTQSVASIHSSGHTSRYDPVQLPQGRESSFSLTNQNTTPQYGIATPQFALQQSLPAQPLSIPSNQKAVEQINEEKKKSDAYDFPLDLFPKKSNIAHAKPVRVPTFAPGAGQHVPGTNIPTIAGQNDTRRHVADRSSHDRPPPKNPYANLVAPQSKAQVSIHMPIQGSANVGFGSKPFPQVGVTQNIPHSTNSQYPAMSLLPADRGRGYSNASIGGLSSKSIEQPIANPTAPQFPSTSRKTSATKYAPTSTAQGTHSYSSVTGKVANGMPTNVPPFSGLPSANVQTSAPPMIPFGGLTSAKTYSGQTAKVMPPALNVPGTSVSNNIISPTSATSTRRSHARSNSSVYTPNQNEYTAKYAPTVHPQYQNTGLFPQLPGQELEAPYAAVRRARPESLDDSIVPEAIDEPVDNQALLHRQFPLIHWSASDKIVYAIPSEAAPNSYMINAGSSLQCLEVININSKIPSNNLLKSFPGPLNKNKVKKKDLEKWLDSILIDYQDSSLEYTILAILRQKLAETIDWKEVARCLYNSDELLSYLSQPLIDSKPRPVSSKLDAGAQLRVLAYLQTGGREKALALAIEKGDYAMALLIGSLLGKDKWAEVVQIYLKNEFRVDSDVSHFSSNLLSLVFQVFVGNAKTAIQEFYSTIAKGQWAVENWRIIVAAVLSNINLDSTAASGGNVPPIINEFLVEYGVFLAQKGLSAEACVVFSIANMAFSTSPIGNTSVKFEQIGSPMSLEGSIFSEIYEFVSCPDVKGYPSLLSLKLYHAFCLQEHGLVSAASRYADHINGMLKHFPKKDPYVLHIANGLTELSSRVAGSSTGWLGKPKLSSVWGQLDKSFNKYIGGDDDSIVQKPTGKKVFDGFTPVASRNSSMLDVSQFQFTPAHKQTQMGYSTDQNISLPPVSANPMDASFQNINNNNHISRNITEQGPPPSMSPYSVNSSPQQPNSQALHNTFNPAQFQLRRVQTEQAKGTTSTGSHPLTAARQQIAQMEAFLAKDDSFDPPSNLAPSIPISRTSPHYRSTPDLLQKRSLNDDLTPAKPKVSLKETRINDSETIQASSVSSSVEYKISNMNTTENVTVQNENRAISNELAYQRGNYSQTSITSPEEVSDSIHDSHDTKPAEALAEVASESRSVDRDQSLNMEEGDSIDEMASSSVLHNDIFGGPHGGIPPNFPKTLLKTTANAYEPINHGSHQKLPMIEDRAMETTGFPRAAHDPFAISQLNRDSSTEGVAPQEKEGKASRASESYNDDREFQAQVPFSPALGKNSSIHRVVNPYAPALAEKRHGEYEPETGSPITGAAKTNAYSLGGPADDVTPKELSEESGKSILPAISSPIEESASTGTPPVDRFDPIKPPDVLTAEIFEPVIKKASASRAFTPLIAQSTEDQYDDIVEDESDDEDEEEQRRQLEKQQQEKRKKEQEEKKRKEQEEAQAAKAKQKADDKANGWFSWLKKDSNEKKPIKAKLGHKTTFYYDEKLKRWVNKDASEDEKEKIASPPPPPPVVKRMDNGPKTKPLPSPEATAKDTVGAILPKNPITGAPLGSSTLMSVANGDSPAVGSPAPIIHPGINLSGKKANGLDDLLSLTGGNGTSSRRKRKPARGYVNVMDTK